MWNALSTVCVMKIESIRIKKLVGKGMEKYEKNCDFSFFKGKNHGLKKKNKEKMDKTFQKHKSNQLIF